MPADTLVDPWLEIPGQPEAVQLLRANVDRPVHAYLFVGPPGSGKRAAVRAFAGELLSVGRDEAYRERSRRLAASEQHPDLVFIEPDATTFRFPKASADPDSPGLRFVREVSSSPREGDRKVVVAVDFHLAREEAIGKLLKTVEEPPLSTIVVLLEDEVPPDQITIASRCARVSFGPLSPSVILSDLRSMGVSEDDATVIADAARGDLSRARLLVNDPGLRDRLEHWRCAPAGLDGSGAAVHRTVAGLLDLINAAQAPIDAKHATELEEFDEQAKARGERGRRKSLIERHKREVRRHRAAEIRVGLSTLAAVYRAELTSGANLDPIIDSLDAIVGSGDAMAEHNPVERLLLYSLFLRLGRVEQGATGQ